MHKKHLALLAAVVLAAAPAAAGEFGLAITTMNHGPYDDASDCPQGMTVGARELFTDKMPAKQREEWLARDKRIGDLARYLTQTLSDYRDDAGTNSCFNPTSVVDPPMHTGQSKKGYGLDLDGGDTSTHCGHNEFTGTGGVTGIDNQVARLTACMDDYQKNKDSVNRGRNFSIQSGRTITLLHVTGVDDPLNDPDVTVDFYRSRDRLVNDGTGAALPDATVSADPESALFHAKAHGRIVGGELITDPADVNLPVVGPAEAILPHFIRGLRVHIKMNADGYGEGLLAGYQDLETYYGWWAKLNPAARKIYSCPALYKAMHDLADGYKDPKTGQCTALSTALNIKAVRTFVVPPPATTASAP